MKQRIGPFDVDVYRAEQEKFSAPLLLLHGLWTGPWVWHQFAGFFSHRGWTSYVPVMRGTGLAPPDLSVALSQLAEEIEVPVVIGHDLGGLLAVMLSHVRGSVALAPLPAGRDIRRHPLFAALRARWAHLRRQPLLPPARAAAIYLGVPASAPLLPEPSSWVDTIADLGPALAARRGLPALVIAGREDRTVAPQELERFATQIGAEFCVQEGADHGLPYGPAWLACASLVHRWIVRRCGESLLLLRGDEDLRDE